MAVLPWMGVTIPTIFTSAEARASILRRSAIVDTDVSSSMLDINEKIWGARLTPDQVVGLLVADVAARGDAAVRDATEKVDRVRLDQLEVGRDEIARAYEQVDETVTNALRLAVEQVQAFHERHLPKGWLEFNRDGALGQLVRPIERIGLHVPGGRASYPSTVIMSAIPARVAGCKNIIMCSPPQRNGHIAPVTLVAADIASVDRVFSVGGAQSIAAMAYGTESIPRVDKIVGPGNLYVVLAKRRVFGQVGIDQIPGPTETMLIVDESVDPRGVAADLLAQAEHDPLASAIALVSSHRLAEAVQSAVIDQLNRFDRADIARASLRRGGGIVVVPSIAEAIDIANDYAPEHLCLLISDAWSWIGHIQNAGGVFVGEHSLEAIGDYTAGPSHVMPTNGTARFSSGLSVFDFVKFMSVFGVNRAGLERLGPPAIALARSEGLGGHAQAVVQRIGEPPATVKLDAQMVETNYG